MKKLSFYYLLITFVVVNFMISEAQQTDTCKIDFTNTRLIAIDASNNDVIYSEDDDVENNKEIVYKCRAKYTLEGQKINMCVNGKWKSNHPRCTRYCPIEDISGATIKALCEYNNERISCNSNLRPGTRVKLSCQIGYSLPNKRIKEVIFCDNDGRWDYQPFTCDPVCGTEPIETHPFILNGDKVNNTIFPWHAGIYELESNSYKLKCGGTIISERIIVSAAHCFWDFSKMQVHDKSLFTVAVGKYYRDIDANESIPPQFFNLTELYLHPGFKHIYSNFNFNIAILIVNKIIEYNMYVKPVCIEWLSLDKIESNVIGRVAGWGHYDLNKKSDELRVADLPTINYIECYTRTAGGLLTSVTNDSFCINTNGEQNVCEGDFGGGFVIPRTYEGLKKYYMWGIVTNSISSGYDCKKGSNITKVTNLQFYSNIINDFWLKYMVK